MRPGRICPCASCAARSRPAGLPTPFAKRWRRCGARRGRGCRGAGVQAVAPLPEHRLGCRRRNAIATCRPRRAGVEIADRHRPAAHRLGIAVSACASKTARSSPISASCAARDLRMNPRLHRRPGRRECRTALRADTRTAEGEARNGSRHPPASPVRIRTRRASRKSKRHPGSLSQVRCRDRGFLARAADEASGRGFSTADKGCRQARRTIGDFAPIGIVGGFTQVDWSEVSSVAEPIWRRDPMGICRASGSSSPAREQLSSGPLLQRWRMLTKPLALPAQ